MSGCVRLVSVLQGERSLNRQEQEEMLRDVLHVLERQVEWPLTDVIEYEKVLQLLGPLRSAINLKIKELYYDL